VNEKNVINAGGKLHLVARQRCEGRPQCWPQPWTCSLFQAESYSVSATRRGDQVIGGFATPQNCKRQSAASLFLQTLLISLQLNQGESQSASCLPCAENASSCLIMSWRLQPLYRMSCLQASLCLPRLRRIYFARIKQPLAILKVAE